MTIRSQIYIGTGTIGSLLLAIIALFILTIAGVNKSQQNSLGYTSVTNAVVTLNKLTYEFVQTEDPDIKFQWFKKHEELSKLLVTHSDSLAMNNVHALSEVIRQSFSEMIALKTFSFNNQLENIEEQETAIISRLNSASDEITKLVLTLVDEEQLRMARIMRQGQIILILVLAIYFIVIVIFFYLVNQRFVQPLRVFTTATKAIADGDLSFRIEKYNQNDELGLLAIAFNKMTSRLQDLYKNMESNVYSRTTELENALEKESQTRSAMINVLSDLKEEQAKTNAALQTVQKFQQAVESTSDGVLITDVMGKINYVNPAWTKQTGYSSEEAHGHDWDMVHIDSLDESIVKPITEAMSRGETFHTEDIKYIRKDGSEYDVELSMYAITNEQGEKYYVSVHKDISRRKREDIAKSEFVSLASHQLRTPLTAMRWSLGRVMKKTGDSLGEDIKRILEVAQAATRNMAEVIRVMLSISRIEAGKMKVSTTPVNVTKLLQTIDAEMNILYTEKKHIVNINCDDALSVETDEDLLSECLTNIVTNSVKYTPDGGKIDIKVTEKQKQIHIEVSDNGMGIPKAEQGKIFSKFFRAENVVDQIPEGTGLGLYLVYSLVQLLGGSISFASTEGTGTSFTISLPLSPVTHE